MQWGGAAGSFDVHSMFAPLFGSFQAALAQQQQQQAAAALMAAAVAPAGAGKHQSAGEKSG